MKVAVCLKHAADPLTSEFDVHADALVERDWVLGPAELVALEQALRLAGTEGGTVTAVTVGPPRAEAVLRLALTYGAAAALRVWDDALAPGDSFVTARVLAAALAELRPDVVLCGTRSLDGGSGCVGPALAERLDAPYVSNVAAVALDGGSLLAARAGDAGWRDEFRVGLPAVLGVDEGLNEPRYVAVLGRTYRRGLAVPIESRTPASLGLGADELRPAVALRAHSQPRPRTKSSAKVTGMSMKEKLNMMRGQSGKKDKEIFTGPPAEAAQLLLGKLKEWL